MEYALQRLNQLEEFNSVGLYGAGIRETPRITRVGPSIAEGFHPSTMEIPTIHFLFRRWLVTRKEFLYCIFRQ